MKNVTFVGSCHPESFTMCHPERSKAKPNDLRLLLLWSFQLLSPLFPCCHPSPKAEDLLLPLPLPFFLPYSKGIRVATAQAIR